MRACMTYRIHDPFHFVRADDGGHQLLDFVRSTVGGQSGVLRDGLHQPEVRAHVLRDAYIHVMRAWGHGGMYVYAWKCREDCLCMHTCIYIQTGSLLFATIQF